ncbi:MAG: hypothetical protein K8S23_03700 [Candidatus Cloacimonetes bacterium]|nr:hypothetical protein [Candidatus Cloacimonadota bacterium]
MKKKQFIIFILFVIYLTTLIADDKEFGYWFKQSTEKSKENYFEPENKQITIKRWKHEKDKMISDYKKYLKRDIKGEFKPRREIETRSSIVSYYFYDKTDPEINKIVDFYIFVYENDIDKFLRIAAFKILVNIAFKDNQTAIGYIHSQANNQNLGEINRLKFYIVKLALIEEVQSLDYLSDLIDEAQLIETTDIEYFSPIEQTIVSTLVKFYIPKRYQKDYCYESSLPILRKLIFSRSVSVQKSACFQYYYHTNRTEMRTIFNEYWTKVQDKSTPRIEFINALYGLQALYGLSKRNIGKYKIGFKEISSYFIQFGGLTLIDDKWIYIPSDKIKRLTKDEITYFHQRFKRMKSH